MKFLNLFLNYSKNEIGIENFEFINLIVKEPSVEYILSNVNKQEINMR